MGSTNYGQSTPLSKLTHQYVTDRLRRGEIGRATAANMRVHLRSFVEAHGNRPLDQLGLASMHRWFESMETAGLASSTRSVRLSTIRGFARWAVLHRHVARDFTLGVGRIRRVRQVPRDLTADHYRQVFAVAASDLRLQVILGFMFVCGCRCVEVARLRVEDIDRAAMLVHLVGKAGHERNVPLTSGLLTTIDRYVADTGQRSGPLLRRLDGTGSLSPSRISHLVSWAIADAGLKVRPYDGRSAHGWRACAASDMFDACRDPRVVATFLGHQGIGNLRPYMRRTETEEVRAAQARRFLGAA